MQNFKDFRLTKTKKLDLREIFAQKFGQKD